MSLLVQVPAGAYLLLNVAVRPLSVAPTSSLGSSSTAPPMGMPESWTGKLPGEAFLLSDSFTFTSDPVPLCGTG